MIIPFGYTGNKFVIQVQSMEQEDLPQVVFQMPAGLNVYGIKPRVIPCAWLDLVN